MEPKVWPFDDLVVRTPRLELRLPTDDDLVALGETAAAGIYPDDQPVPFLVAWNRDKSRPELIRSVLQWGWRCRGELTAESWQLGFAVICDGRAVGVQSIKADEFATAREINSGSWIGQEHQGQGIGREMRIAVLQLAFAGLGALSARSSAFTFNPASISVSDRVGYQRDGIDVRTRDGERLECLRFRMTRDQWEKVSPGWPEITIDGVDPCRPLLLGDDHQPE
jgi:RimJ/RimL family protein N-acetyltransferase